MPASGVWFRTHFAGVCSPASLGQGAGRRRWPRLRWGGEVATGTAAWELGPGHVADTGGRNRCTPEMGTRCCGPVALDSTRAPRTMRPQLDVSRVARRVGCPNTPAGAIHDPRGADPASAGYHACWDHAEVGSRGGTGAVTVATHRAIRTEAPAPPTGLQRSTYPVLAVTISPALRLRFPEGRRTALVTEPQRATPKDGPQMVERRGQPS